MSTRADLTAPGVSPAVSLRPEEPGDEPFVFTVYASTRAEELALTNWDQTVRRLFLDQQFKAMRAGYRGMFPAAENLIICLAGLPAGRMVVNRSPAEICVVDIALLPEHRNRGVGTWLLRRICAEAASAGKPVRLSVVKHNRAARWYARLGFIPVREQGFHDELEWRADAPSPAG